MKNSSTKRHTLQHTFTIVGISVLVSASISLGILGVNARMTAAIIDQQLGGVPSPIEWELLQSPEANWDKKNDSEGMHEAKDWHMWMPENMPPPPEQKQDKEQMDALVHQEFKVMMNEAIEANDQELLQEILDEYANWQHEKGQEEEWEDMEKKMENQHQMFDAWIIHDDVHFLADELTELFSVLKEKEVKVSPMVLDAFASAKKSKEAALAICPAYNQKEWESALSAMLTTGEKEQYPWSWQEVEHVVALLYEIADSSDNLSSELRDEIEYVAGYLTNYLKTGANKEHVTYKLEVAYELMDKAEFGVEEYEKWQEDDEWKTTPLLEKQYESHGEYSMDCALTLVYARAQFEAIHDLLQMQSQFDATMADVLDAFFSNPEFIDHEPMMKEGSVDVDMLSMPPKPPHMDGNKMMPPPPPMGDKMDMVPPKPISEKKDQ